ncbi:MAG: 23S rRNA (adenine(2503)-C(2))-methyltransferase RlmN [Deltaproteobacteria bacterium]|nr:23S rRNA (adenine(2503)-C(2))-methyltransferase RlmN [Deltaproteobacteria bacterium]MBW2417015.1 23S rRNA (adenine(2503)-C(2))-methyltransferase RlmN [Deltaproteobacteria bacterium]
MQVEAKTTGLKTENLKDHSLAALRERFARDGIARYHADQVAGWLYQRGVEDPRHMTDLSMDLREQLAGSWISSALEVAGHARSVDGTLKLLLRAHDGAVVEAVLIPEEQRTTLCVSTQVGCPLACSFCATGALGFTRNLSTAEIVDQLCRAREFLAPDQRISNVVFMGMGEPLLNLPAVSEAIRLLVDPKAFAMAPRRITVSTSGVVPKIRPLLELAPVNLAVSLHATTNAVRDELVPLNRRFPLEQLLGALRDEEQVNRRRPVFFEYTLIEGVNDTPGDARRLVGLLRGIPSKVNAIPMNAHPDSGYRAPKLEVMERFTAIVHEAGLRVTLRKNRGDDIDAACGQLAARGGRGESEEPGPRSLSGGPLEPGGRVVKSQG